MSQRCSHILTPLQGAIVLQMVLAGAIGGLLYFRSFLAKLASVFMGRAKVAQVAGTATPVSAGSAASAAPGDSAAGSVDERHGA